MSLSISDTHSCITIISWQYRFTNTSGSSGSSSANLKRHVAMTQAKTLSNVVTSVSSFTSKPAMVPLVTKSSEDDEANRKYHELKRLKEKEAEAARKREELIKAKAEEQKKYSILPRLNTLRKLNIFPFLENKQKN